MASSPSTMATTTRGAGGDGEIKQSLIYKAIVTPVSFVSFLISLAWVDFRYSLMRSHSHSEDPSGMPAWLHRILYRAQPYQYVRVAGDGGDGGRSYYHSKQKKLLKMEAEEAFEIRSAVLMVLGLLLALAGWGSWVLLGWLWRQWRG